MRYDQTAAFYEKGQRRYNPRTSTYEGGAQEIATIECNVTDLGTNRQVQLLGALKQGQKVVRLQTRPPEKWSFLVLSNDNDKHYILTTALDTLKGYTLIVGEQSD